MQANGFLFKNVLVLKYQIWKGNYRTRMEKPPEKHSTLSVTVYIFYTLFRSYFHINCIHVSKGAAGTDEVL